MPVRHNVENSLGEYTNIMAKEEEGGVMDTYLSLANLRQEEDLKLSTKRSLRYIQEVKLFF